MFCILFHSIIYLYLTVHCNFFVHYIWNYTLDEIVITFLSTYILFLDCTDGKLCWLYRTLVEWGIWRGFSNLSLLSFWFSSASDFFYCTFYFYLHSFTCTLYIYLHFYFYCTLIAYLHNNPSLRGTVLQDLILQTLQRTCSMGLPMIICTPLGSSCRAGPVASWDIVQVWGFNWTQLQNWSHSFSVHPPFYGKCLKRTVPLKKTGEVDSQVHKEMIIALYVLIWWLNSC